MCAIVQDADLVWISDPLPHLRESIHDIAFMDDGARCAVIDQMKSSLSVYIHSVSERHVSHLSS